MTTDEELEKKAEAYYQREVKSSLAPVTIRLAYIAGAKEDGVVWHDLRRNPEDLPEEKKTVLCLTDVLTVTAQYDKELDGFFRLDKGLAYCIWVATVYAWCEIPKFKREV